MRRNSTYRLVFLIGCLLLLWLLVGFAAYHAPLALTLPWETIDGGGGGGGSGGCFDNPNGLQLCGTAGQPDAGAAQAGTFDLHSGFWSGGRLALHRNMLPLVRK